MMESLFLSGLVFTTVVRRAARRKIGTTLHPRNVVRILHQLLKTAD